MYGVLLFVYKHPKLFTLGCLAFIIFLFYQLAAFQYEYYDNEHFYLTQGDYLLLSPSCKIVNLNPWNVDAKYYYQKKEYYSCAQGKKILSKLELDENQIDVYLQLDLPKNSTVSCCIQNVTRAKISATVYNDNIPERDYLCKKIPTSRIQVSNEHPTFITCKQNGFTIYENVHMPIALTKLVQSKLQSNTISNAPSVMILGIDSISRLNMMRTMPHTFKLLENDSEWLQFKIFQKMDDNTFPNLLAILTGRNRSQAMDACKPYVQSKLDECPIIWKDFSKHGYVTAYSEDVANISTFNYYNHGFDKPPTDYYMRAYHLGCAHYLKKTIIDSIQFCSGLESEGERVWDLARDFIKLHKNNPFFALFWINAFGHENVNTPSRIDDKVQDYLVDINDAISENTIVFFLSDHGIRFGPIRNTFTGYMEERLPFLFIRFPKWFQQKYPLIYKNIVDNTNKMVTPYDLHMTLQDILALSDSSYKQQPSLGCPKCHSLFKVIDINRSCQDANITEHWCTCSSLVPLPFHKYRIVNSAMNKILTKLNAMVVALDTEKQCSKFNLDTVISAFQSTNNYGGNANLLVVQFKTEPNATFEASINSDNMEIYGGFSRLDSYKLTSACIKNSALQMFCYCKNLIAKQ